MAQEPSPLSLAEYVQMACVGRHTLVIEVETGHSRGAVWIREGEPWSARFDEKRGEHAFCAMVNSAESAIQVRRWSGPAGPQELTQCYQELLMRAAMEFDLARRLNDLVGAGLCAVIAGDYAKAALLLEQAQAIEPDNVRVRHQRKRLEALGYGGSVGALAGDSGTLGCAPIIAVGGPDACDGGGEDLRGGDGC